MEVTTPSETSVGLQLSAQRCVLLVYMKPMVPDSFITWIEVVERKRGVKSSFYNVSLRSSTPAAL